MKKGALIFEKRIRKNLQGRYFDTVFTDKVLSRYASVVDELYLLARVDTLDLPDDEISAKFSSITLQNVRVVEIPNILSPFGLFHVCSARCRILECLANMDVIFLRIPSVWQCLVTKWAAKWGKTAILEVGADAWATYWHDGWAGKLLAPFMEFSTKRVIRSAAHVVYVTDKWLQGKYPTSGESIACSNVDIDAQSEHVLDERLEKIRHMAGDVHLGTLGSVSARSKGQDAVIEALAFLKSRGHCNFIYHLAGPGNPRRLLSLAAHLDVTDNVRFDGLLRHDQIGDWFRSIDLYVQPSRQEGLPRALIEAMSYALPAFGAHTGGIPELLSPSFIFRHSRRGPQEISRILMEFDKDRLEKSATDNFALAKNYASDVIEKRRHLFFSGCLQDMSRVLEAGKCT